MKRIKSQKGFSLVELMIVVAIIGILAAIGIPQYSKFQAKARQSEAKGIVSAMFAAETSFFGEWNQYSVDLKNIGYAQVGTGLRYRGGFSIAACPGYSAATAPAETAGNQVSDAPALYPGGVVPAGMWVSVAIAPAAPPAAFVECSTTQFAAGAFGSPLNTYDAANPDRWYISENKVISNPVSGL